METDRTQRPLAVSVLSASLTVVGAFLTIFGFAAFFRHITLQITGEPFHHPTSVTFHHWEIGCVLLGFGLWWFLSGRGLWKLRTRALTSSFFIGGFIFLYGLVLVLPPQQEGDMKTAVWLMGIGTVIMISLWRAAPAFRTR